MWNGAWGSLLGLHGFYVYISSLFMYTFYSRMLPNTPFSTLFEWFHRVRGYLSSQALSTLLFSGKRGERMKHFGPPVPPPEGTRPVSCRSRGLHCSFSELSLLPAPAALWGQQQGQMGPQCQGPAGLWLCTVAQETEIAVMEKTSLLVLAHPQRTYAEHLKIKEKN